METSGLLDWWEKYGRFGLIGVGLGLIILGGFWMFFDYQNQTADIEFFETGEKVLGEGEVEDNLVVYISGAVKNPGVYELDPDSRLHQLLTSAGEFSEEADVLWVEKNLNMARKLADGEKIYIPSREEISSQPEVIQEGVPGQNNRIVNINTAVQTELETLPGIGPSFAQRIIDYRQENGGFKSTEEVQAVSGIGEKTFEKIKDQISI